MRGQGENGASRIWRTEGCVRSSDRRAGRVESQWDPGSQPSLLTPGKTLELSGGRFGCCLCVARAARAGESVPTSHAWRLPPSRGSGSFHLLRVLLPPRALATVVPTPKWVCQGVGRRSGRRRQGCWRRAGGSCGGTCCSRRKRGWSGKRRHPPKNPAPLGPGVWGLFSGCRQHNKQASPPSSYPHAPKLGKIQEPGA